MSNSFDVTLQVTDWDAFRAAAMVANPDLEDDADHESLVSAALVYPRTAPLDSGYEIHSSDVLPLGEDRFTLRLVAEVFDADALLTAAKASYMTSWSDPEWEPECIGEALYEHVVGSNEMPAPLDIGFEIIDHDYEKALQPRP